MSAARLYTPELLGLAVELARWPRLAGTACHGDARSPTCGSTLTIDLELDEAGGIARIGMAVRACAVGQASAAIFARHAEGRSASDIARAGSIGAMLLPWKAALAALSSTAPAG